MKKIDISPLLIAALCILAYCFKAEVFFSFLLAAVIHELSHIVLCKLTNAEILALSLGISGVALKAQFKSSQQELICVAAGPVSNLFCFIAFFHFPNFALFNLLLGIYNLLPLSNLDGGRLLFLLLPFSFDQNELICRITEMNVLIILICGSSLLCCKYHAGLWSVLGCLILLLRSRTSEKNLQICSQRRKIKKKHVEGKL